MPRPHRCSVNSHHISPLCARALSSSAGDRPLSPGEQKSQAAVGAFKHEAVRVLVTLSPEHAAHLGEVPDHVYLANYVPHSTVLANSRLVITHAGHGIVMKALYHGVPMVLVPWGRDQPGVAARAEALGVATVVRREAFNNASVDQAVHRILNDPRYTERARAISKRLQAADSVGVACAQLDTFLTSGAERKH
jgi:MGT family glycosyltransferase